MLRVLYFAKLREDLGRSAETVELPAEVTTVAALRAHLIARGAPYGQAFAANRAIRVAVNQDLADPDTPVRAGDEVAFFPPVTGG